MSPLLRNVLFSGTGAALASIATVMLLSRAETGSAWRGVNATSHFLVGPDDAVRDEVDVTHSATGIATNAAAAFFWAALFAVLRQTRGRSRPAGIIGDASAIGLLAAIIDYLVVPKRLTPGWELALSKRSVAASLAAMAVGLAAGALTSEGGERQRRVKARDV